LNKTGNATFGFFRVKPKESKSIMMTWFLAPRTVLSICVITSANMMFN